MKIRDISTFVVSQKLGEEKFSYSQAWYNTRTICLLKITTDNGIVGWGECFGPAYIHKTTIDRYYTPYLIGKNPLDRESIWNHLYNMLRDHGQYGLSVESLSGIDVALWDIAGRFFNQPVWQLLGGKQRDTITPYATGLYLRESGNPVEYLAEEALMYREKGFRGLKMKVGFGIDKDIEMVRAVRNAIGPDMFLAMDANHAYDTADALRLIRLAEEYDISWFEEPVIPEDIAGYAYIRGNSTIPISGGEAHFTRWGFKRLLENGCVDIAQPDTCVTGGISEVMKISALCSAYGIRLYPHVWGSAIALSAAINICFALPDTPASLNPGDMLLEYDRTPNVFRDELAGDFIQMTDGRLSAPGNPGLGITIDEELLKKLSV